MRHLDYKGVSVDEPRRTGGVAVIVGTIVAALVHIIACSVTSFELFRLAGGIRTSGAWTMYGGIDYAWTNLAWLPGGLLFAVGPGGPARPPPGAPLAMLTLLAGSVIAGYLLATAVVSAFRGAADHGRFRWRLWAFVPLWFVWLPVPVKMTVTYWHTVAY